MNLPGTGDTIAAIATPPGRGGIAVVRVSGPLTADIAHRLLGRVPALRTAVRVRFTDRTGAEIDDGLALRFDAPRSFTGEDVLELQGHGGVVVARMVLERVCELGARPAGPGEFTLRAFLNDRIDLAQAEAIADLIDGASTSAVRCARRSLSGEFSRTVDSHRDALVELRAFIEASIDFPDEELDLLATPETAARLEALRTAIATTLAESRRGAVLRNGVKLVIAGAPNVGKSSLLNRLARTDAAIVTDVPGTTRDVVRERVVIAGIPFDVHDTAGLRETTDPVERIGVERAADAIDDADLVLVVVDDRDTACDADQDPFLERAGAAAARIAVRNKIDLSGAEPGVGTDSEGMPTARVSALEGSGLGELEEAIVERVMRGTTACEDAFMARRRHLDALERALAALDRAQCRLTVDNAGELVAEELRDAQGALGAITGEFATEDLLAQIFSSFCIGK